MLMHVLPYTDNLVDVNISAPNLNMNEGSLSVNTYLLSH